jgi:hypothetical protein
MLVTCPECDAEISHEARVCPKCGKRDAGSDSKESCEEYAERLRNDKSLQGISEIKVVRDGNCYVIKVYALCRYGSCSNRVVVARGNSSFVNWDWGALQEHENVHIPKQESQPEQERRKKTRGSVDISFPRGSRKTRISFPRGARKTRM